MYVEGVEEFLLSGGFSGDELNIVDQQNITVPIALVELVHFLLGKAFDHLVGEIVALDVKHAEIGFFLFDLVDHRAHQVRLTQTAVSVNKEGIVVGGGTVGNGAAGGVSKLIGITHDEIFKGIFKFENIMKK